MVQETPVLFRAAPSYIRVSQGRLNGKVEVEESYVGVWAIQASCSMEQSLRVIPPGAWSPSRRCRSQREFRWIRLQQASDTYGSAAENATMSSSSSGYATSIFASSHMLFTLYMSLSASVNCKSSASMRFSALCESASR